MRIDPGPGSWLSSWVDFWMARRSPAGVCLVTTGVVVLLVACAAPKEAAVPTPREAADLPSRATEVEEGTGRAPVPRGAQEAASVPGAAGPPAALSLREVFPHVRVDAKAGVIEFDATVSIDAHDPKKPDVYLETLVCIPNSKEYESLVVTPAKPSHVHAGLLLVGLSPGAPGSWVWEGTKVRGVPPSGPPVKVRMVVDGREVAPGEWVKNRKRGTLMTQVDAGDEFVFAGSLLVGGPGKERYKADVEGCLVGLTTFGAETIAWTRLSNPEAAAEEPHWVADPSMPNFGTPVVVRVSRMRDGEKE